MVKSFGWCNMKKGGVDNKNIHTAVFSASIFAIIFILSDIIKEELNKHDLENKHLILCINNCNFYFSDADSETRSKIFLGKNVDFKKIAEIQKNQLKETLYLLSKSL